MRSGSITIARPYAEAIYRLAKESKTIDDWSAQLQHLTLLSQDEDMARIVASPLFSKEQVVSLFFDCCTVSAKDKETLRNFLHVLAENNRLAFLPAVSELFEAQKNIESGEQDALIESAFPIDPKQLKVLLGDLEGYFNSKLKTRVEVDEALIGGIRVTIGDQVLDASVQGKLESMSLALKA